MTGASCCDGRGPGARKTALQAGRLRLPGFRDLAAVQAEQMAVHRFGQAGVQRIELQPQMVQALRTLHLGQY